MQSQNTINSKIKQRLIPYFMLGGSFDWHQVFIGLHNGKFAVPPKAQSKLPIASRMNKNDKRRLQMDRREHKMPAYGTQIGRREDIEGR
jgi:hypothetical protein